MFSFMVVLIALIAAVLILVILMQSGQGQGLSGIASGGATRQVLGTRQAPDMLEKATWTLAAVFISLCVITNFFIDTGEQESVIQQRAQDIPSQQGQTPPSQGGGAAPLPGQGGGPGGGSGQSGGGGN
ncbi:preprotein translocase subunit SecG [Salinibacter ruber]|uniref:Protein-export membrane protein SecG n=1 Tax=Salinibacter ruber TaxID=146919 RepID=A0A9X2U7M3_9BACT|nr:preprotein translocase subunit SecG [Salinibacter ruber]MCS3951298.1 preprotein translocase subunit SecG [Salinibacter ruber]MCS4118000.1 preprotein translocase subunit SecG [Salinibacter ruber]MCS4154962.1 preprotein translocase subunit SecG [Salinibacter ruber]